MSGHAHEPMPPRRSRVLPWLVRLFGPEIGILRDLSGFKFHEFGER